MSHLSFAAIEIGFRIRFCMKATVQAVITHPPMCLTFPLRALAVGKNLSFTYTPDSQEG